jgi:hypothetical protein
MTTYIAFVASPTLRQDSEQLIRNIDSHSKDSQADLLSRIITRFTDEILQVFFIDMIALLNLNPFMTKVVTGSVNTIKSTIHRVSKTIINKLDNQQLTPLSHYMSSVMLTATTDGITQPYVGFPISAATHARLQQLFLNIRHDTAPAHTEELIAALCEITDLALDVYLLTPIELLKLNFILRKLAEGSVTVIRGAIHMVIRRLVPDLGVAQMQAIANYLGSLVLHNAQTYR